MPDAAERARSLHARGRSAVGAGRPDRGARLLRTGLQLLEPHLGEHALAARLMISLAAAEVLLGHSQVGIALLDRAQGFVAPQDLAILEDQRGWVHLYLGELDDAVRCMSLALPLLEAGSDPQAHASCLLNRAMAHELAGRVRLCKADLQRCEEVAHAARLPRVLAKARLNLGYCEMLAGDVPAALRAFERARTALAEHAPAVLPQVGMDKARALLGVGLTAEAARELDGVLAALSRARPTHERAEAELVRAHVALAQGKPAEARRWARRAERRFTRRANATWAKLAVLTRLRADFAEARQISAIPQRAEELASSLTTLGLRHDAEVASLLAVRAYVRSRDLGAAQRQLGQYRTRRPRLEVRLLRRLATAELRRATGQVAGSLAEARAGLVLLRDYRGRLGSVDLQTSTATLGNDLARLGLSTSLRTGRPHVVFSWLERTRAQAFGVRQARVRTDPVVADAVSALRQAAVAARSAELAGRPDHAARRRCAELEREIRSHGWQADGSGSHLVPARFTDVTQALHEANAVLVSFFTEGEHLGALVITNRTGRIVRMGRLSAITETAALLRGDLDAMCGRALPSALAAVVTASAQRQIAVLADALVAPMRSLLGDHDLVVVPTGALAAVPWNLLPGLRGRPLTVAMSASAWSRTAHANAPFVDPLLVAGPHLRHADDEVRKIAATFPDSEVLCGPQASVAATLTALGRRNCVHFAAHGHHEPGNFLFSRLDLADGPLMAYDVHQLDTVPQQVVLSSCDIGRNVVRTGNEMLGFTAALLYSGTATVIAAVARVPDDLSADVMSQFYALRARDVPPAAALAEACAETLVPLVCFGRG
ncbi:CHAT domain-containing protein [Lentzea sp. NPDC102401]|uniref:CHAT domain-containing protein n=1 Tax=Lentzea sp. NPDC102401 TaxID=3364128 RepID=UPI003829B43E